MCKNKKIFRKEKLGQVTLETAFAMIVTILLLLGTTYIFVWLNKCMVERKEHYTNQQYRYDTNENWNENFYQPSALEIFKK